MAAVALAAAAVPVDLERPGGGGAWLRAASASAQHGGGGHAAGHGAGGARGGGCCGAGAGGHGGGGRHPGGHDGAEGQIGRAAPGAHHVPGGIASDHLTGEDHDAHAHPGTTGTTGGRRGRGGVPAAGVRGGGPGSGVLGGGAAGRGGRDPAAAQAPVRSPEGRGRRSGALRTADARGGGGRSSVWPGPTRAELPRVELGRLNVARVPSRVLDRALAEASAELSPEAAAWYALSLDEALAALPELGHGARLEGPLANLSLYRAALAGGAPLPVTPADRLDLAALAFGSAAGRHAPVEPDTVVAVSRLLGVEDRLDAGSLARLTDGAERVRQAILAAHGEDGHDDEGHEDGGHAPGGGATDDHAH